MRYGVQYSVGSTKIFFPIYTSNQNSVCTFGCIEPVEGIKSFNFPQNRMWCYGGLKLHKMHTIRKLSKRAFFEDFNRFFLTKHEGVMGKNPKLA